MHCPCRGYRQNCLRSSCRTGNRAVTDMMTSATRHVAISGELRDQILRFGLLFVVSFLYHFFQDTLGPVRITHIHIGACKIKFGADFVTLLEQPLSEVFFLLFRIQLIEVEIDVYSRIIYRLCVSVVLQPDIIVGCIAILAAVSALFHAGEVHIKVHLAIPNRSLRYGCLVQGIGG